MGKIAGSLVILDEIQLLQDNWLYSLSLLPYHIVNLVVFGATLIIMTATLPELLIEEVERSLRLFEVSQEIKYSWISIKTNPSEDIIRRGKLSVDINNGRLLDYILDIVMNHEKPLLLIFNTVERATEAYRQLVKNGYNSVVLLHSRLISDVRKNRESFFEKNPFNRDLIVIATQVVEAGLDYDFKTVATEISPIDSLIQRIGRCARKSDGIALIFKDLEQTKHVYPQIVMEETEKILDKHSLAESVKNVSVASSLVNAVYSKDIVEELKREVSDELRGALSFIKTFPTDKIFKRRDLFNEQAQNILRLGMEIKCILLPQEIYQRVLENMRPSEKDKIPVELDFNQAINLLNQNILSLSIKRVFRSFEIPALKHRVNDKEIYLSFSLAHSTTDSDDMAIEIIKYDDLSKAIKCQGGIIHPFIINPSYYLYEEDYHLGLVKPYEKTAGM
jgi:CRISPR-associated endonuclease/helicase Cas3